MLSVQDPPSKAVVYPLAIFVIVLSLLVARRQRKHPQALPYPPGPPGNVLVGNMSDAAAEKPWYRYTELMEQYGEIFHLSALGQHIVVLNTVEVAEELLTKRARVYSDRPQIPMVQLTGWDLAAPLIGYGDIWRAHRRVFQQGFNPRTILNYRSAQTERLAVFLNQLLDQPEKFLGHTHQLVASTIMKIVYSHEISDGTSDDRLMDATRTANARISAALLPGAWMVNSFPFLKSLPRWFPGCRAFNAYAEDTRELVRIMSDETYEFAKENSKQDPCLVTILEDLKHSPTSKMNISEEVFRGVCATAFSAGSETTIVSLSAFYLAMRQHPHVQLKAQNEIIRVVGSTRLPGLDDRASLPYVEAVYREVMRWMPALPLGVPHSTTADDVYKGYFIPKGSTVFSNIWAMVNDEQKYAEPYRFMPERYMNEDGTINGDDTVLAYGFGRRVCVGKHFADASLWLIMASILSTFTISRPKDDELEHLADPREIFANGTVAQPRPFRCDITPRSAEMANIIRGSINP